MFASFCAQIREFLLELVSLSSELTNHGNPLPVFFHDIFVFVCAVNGSSLLSLAEYFDAVFEIISLAFVLLLDISILVNFLLVQVLDETVEFFRNNFLQLHVVINFLCYPVDGILLFVDGDVVFTDDSAEPSDLIVHLLLVDSQTVDLETRLSVDGIEDSKTIVKLAGLEVQKLNLLFLWLDSSIQILNLKVKHKFELFKFLGLLFELVNFFLSDSDITVLLGNLLFEGRCFFT